jgi:hypothetical protein
MNSTGLLLPPATKFIPLPEGQAFNCAELTQRNRTEIFAPVGKGAHLSQAAEKPVLLKGTASAVPQVFCLQWGFRWDETAGLAGS